MRSSSVRIDWRNGDKMGVLVYVLVTIAVFALLGLTQKLVERL